MLCILIVALVSFLNLVYCVNENTLISSVELIRLNHAYSVTNKCKYSSVTKTVSMKPFKCQSDFLRHRFDDLKQWKRRRRTADNIKHDFRNKSSRFTISNSVEYEVKSYPYSLSYIREELNVSKSTLDIIDKFLKRWPVDQWRKLGMFTDDYLLHINIYWMQFPPPDPVVFYTFAGTYIVLGSIGCFGNVLVLLMYLRLVDLYILLSIYIIFSLTYILTFRNKIYY